MEVSGQLNITAAKPEDRATCTHWVGGRVGPRAGLGAVKKKRFCRLWQNVDCIYIFLIMQVLKRSHAMKFSEM